MERPRPVKVANCPACDNLDVNAIWYGMPAGDPELVWPPNVTVGGCLVDERVPDRVCNVCGHAWQTPVNAKCSRESEPLLLTEG